MSRPRATGASTATADTRRSSAPSVNVLRASGPRSRGALRRPQSRPYLPIRTLPASLHRLVLATQASTSITGKATADAPAEEDEVPQGPARPPARLLQGADRCAVRRLRAQVARERLDHEPADRGRPYRDDAQDQARRQGLDQRLPRQAGDAEAGGDAHGLRQGLARALGRRDQAG